MDRLHGIELIVAYDGSGFAGWQLQPGQRTVQLELERAAEPVAGPGVRVRAACRTDAGVHALGQVVALDSSRLLRPRNWVMALNCALPPDVSVRSACACSPGYDPRYDTREKTYRYLLHLGFARNPLWKDRAWHLGKLVRRELPHPDRMDICSHQLDLTAMREGARSLLGEHDFRAFRASDDHREKTVRTIHQLEIVERYQGVPELVAIEVRGDAFLKNMVRIITGTLIEIGRGRMAAERLASLLLPGATRAQAGETAPPHGLTLVEVKLGRKA